MRRRETPVLSACLPQEAGQSACGLLGGMHFAAAQEQLDARLLNNGECNGARREVPCTVEADTSRDRRATNEIAASEIHEESAGMLAFARSDRQFGKRTGVHLCVALERVE